MDANFSSTIRANIVLIRAELTAFGSDAFQLLLRGCIGIPDLHAHCVVTDRHTMILLDDILTLFPRLEAGGLSVSD
jgi:hypothetical protein